MNSAWCQSCGSPIYWLKLKSGKSMPVDQPLITVENPALVGKLTLVTPDGEVVSKAPLGLRGYRSHFASCPNAKDHRKKVSKTTGGSADEKA